MALAAGSWQCPHSCGHLRTLSDQSLAHVCGSMGEAGRYTGHSITVGGGGGVMGMPSFLEAQRRHLT